MSASTAGADPLRQQTVGRRARDATPRFRDEPLGIMQTKIILTAMPEKNLAFIPGFCESHGGRAS